MTTIANNLSVVKLKPSAKWVRENFDYDPTRADLIRTRIDRNDYPTQAGYDNAMKRVYGKPASKPNKGYMRISALGVASPAHRLIWMWHYGDIPSDYVIDHINGNGRDNNIQNLQLATKSTNAKNSKMSRRNTSGCTGVYKHKPTGMWQVRIMSERKHFSFGFFKSYDEAVSVAENKRKKLGFNAAHGR